jgi:archaellum biogenesis protein FlaJ (TadC family)
MARKSGNILLFAGTIVSFVGLCIVLVRVWRVPEYWVPLMVGLGLLLVGLVRRLTSRD